MLYKTEGIVFRFTKFRETSIIATIYTELFGVQSYIVNGVRSSSSKGKIALYQPLTLLDMVVYHRDHVAIHRIQEVKCLYPYRTLTTHPKKSTIAMFLLEIINKSVREEGHSPGLASFLIQSFQTLDNLILGVENFHLIFLIHLSKYLGFRPYHANEIIGSGILSLQEGEWLRQLLSSTYESPLAMTLDQRRNLLDLLLRFYTTHIEHMGEIRSLQILRTILD